MPTLRTASYHALAVGLAVAMACTVDVDPNASGFYGCASNADCATGKICYFERCTNAEEISTVDACVRFEQGFNELECVTPENSFNCELYDDPACDLAPYFTCLGDVFGCEAGALVNPGMADCVVPDCLAQANQQACQTAQDTIDALACVTPGDEPLGCSDYAGFACSLSSYFGCLAGGYTCNGTTLDTSGATSCVDAIPGCWPTVDLINIAGCEILQDALAAKSCTPTGVDLGCDTFGYIEGDCLGYFNCIEAGVTCDLSNNVDLTGAVSCPALGTCNATVDLSGLLPPEPIGVCEESCMNDNQCDFASNYHCVVGECLPWPSCDEVEDCGAAVNWICDTSTAKNRCVFENCDSNSQCIADTGGEYSWCDLTLPTPRCVQCLSGTDCPNGLGCNNGECPECSTPAECVTPGAACIDGRCACGEGSFCSTLGPLTHCNDVTGECGCAANSECEVLQRGSVCNLTTHQCECTDVSECLEPSAGYSGTTFECSF